MERTLESDPSDHGQQAPAWTSAVVSVVALALCVTAAVVAASSPFAADHRGLAVVAHVLVIAAPMGAGVYALSRQRAGRFGWLLVIAGVVWAPTALAESGQSLLYSVGRVFAWSVELMIIYLVLAFPSGRLQTRIDKALFGTGVLVLALFYLPTALFVEQFPLPNPWTSCETACPSNAFMLTGSEPGVIGDVLVPVRETVYVLLLLAVAGVLGHRVTHATRLMRRVLSPVLTVAIVRIGLTALFVVIRRASPASPGTEAVGVMVLFTTPALAIAFFAGLVRWRMFAVGAVRRLATDFVGPPSGSRVRDLLAGAFEDPSLEIIYWAPEPGQWVDAGGKPVRLPSEGSDRAVTEVSDGGRRVAALVYDAALADPPIMSEVAGGFALVSLENQRLAAELRSSLRELRESRVRILSATDKERRRIERDLHDGAQQRLVALGIKLELARELVESDPHGGSELLREIGTDVDEALGDMRSLAHGVYPSLLADYGLARALRTAAEAGPLPSAVSAGDLGRYPEAIESAVYFCCLEALQNAAKHAEGATSVSLTFLENDDGQLAFEVRDDGPGLAQPVTPGAGLANMRDRIAAVGGSLTIDSPPGGGTRIAGQVPLEPIELSPDLETLLSRATDALDNCFGIFRAVRDQRGGVVDFRVEYVNEAAGRDLGYAREEEVARTLGQLVPGYLDSEALRWHRHVLAAGGPMSREDLAYTGSFADAGHLERAYDVRGAPLDGDRIVLSWDDITERKRTELELDMESAVLDRAGEGVCLIRASDTVIVYANPRFAQIFGYAPGELTGGPISVLNWDEHPGDAERRVREIVEVLERRGEASFEVRNRCKDGTPIWSEAHVTAFEHPDHGKVWATVQRAITERKETRDTLRISEEPLRTGFKRAPLVLFTFDRDLRCTWFFDNHVGLGGDPGAVGKTDVELFGPETGRRLSTINRGVFETGKGLRTDLVLELARGRATFDLAVEPLLGPDGEVQGIAGTAYDVSDQARWRPARPGREATTAREGATGERRASRPR